MFTQQPWFVLRFNHFDPTWRRCWDRDFVDAGRSFVSYRTIEENWISDAIATCADGEGCFLVECSWVLRHYLERHPEHVDTLKQLSKEGRFELLGSGENIVDVNMIHGELLVRNLVLGTLWAEDVLGIRPTTGWHSDGFGSCAQMPQVFRQCGYKWLPAISYNIPNAPYWKGMDGSIIFFSPDATSAPFGGEVLVHRQGVNTTCFRKLAPCPSCMGKGCSDCDNKRFVVGDRAEFAPRFAPPLPGKAGVIMLWGEEFMPGIHVSEDIKKYNLEHPEVIVKQGVYRDLYPFISEYLEQVDNPPVKQISTKVENNPSQSGCYVSRIKIKQGHREIEHQLLAAECWDTLLNDSNNQDTLRNAWKDMTFSAFHDAITSSHCDPAYDELRDLHAGLTETVNNVNEIACQRVIVNDSKSITVFNHTSAAISAPVKIVLQGKYDGVQISADNKQLPVYDIKAGTDNTEVTFLAADVPGINAKSFVIAESKFVIEKITDNVVICGDLTVTAGENGITDVIVKGIGKVCDTGKFMVGELILEHDLGDPWATRSLDRTREQLGVYTHLKGIERCGDSIVISYTGRHPSCDDPHTCADPSVTILTWEQRFILRTGLSYIEVETDVEWYTQGRRLRLAFPSKTKSNTGVFDVPYGVLERERYEGKNNYGGNASGDWPTIHWGGVQTDDHTFAIFNQGTPSYRVEDGVVTVSVLRSPQLPYALLEPESYVAYNYHGMADHGSHIFKNAIYIGTGNWSNNDTGRQAAIFNSIFSTVPGVLNNSLPNWEINAKQTEISAIKSAENGNGIILRLIEKAGNSDEVSIKLPAKYSIANLCNLLEDDGEKLTINNGTIKVAMKPWQIVTVRLKI
jgi:alpha-mannosidase